MDLAPGTKLTHYEIVEPIGKGGMGEVYRARDGKLGRDVAIKVLPDDFARDAERLGRFEREARVLASLNHPGIAAIYGLEHSDDVHYLVLELVPGETLSERIARGPMPVDEAVAVAVKLAEAVEAAHEQGVIHRDLKPANIKLTADDGVKVLDFGLAKGFDDSASASGSGSGPQPASSFSPTITRNATQAGVLLGTAAYMSPEQAKGKSVDRRADVWAFGCVLFEMLTARRVFDGEDLSDVLASVLKDEPDWTALPASTPRAARRLVERCLRKNVRERWQHMGDVRIELEEARSHDESEEVALAAASPKTAPVLWAACGVALGLAAGVLTAFWIRPPAVPEAPLRVFQLVDDVDFWRAGEISPDGRKVVFSRGGRRWVRQLDGPEPRELPDTADSSGVFWSPDSENLAFVAGGELRRIALDGTASRRICGFDGVFQGGTWSGSRIVFAVDQQGLFEVPAGGGEPRSLLVPDLSREELATHGPSFLPDGEGLLYRMRRTNDRVDTIVAVRGETRKEVLRVEGGNIYRVMYASTGHLVYWQIAPSQAVWAVPFSLTDLSVEGEATLVAADGMFPSLSDEGTLTYISGIRSAGDQLFWVDRGGRVGAPVGQRHEDIRSPALSPDGRRVAIMGDDGNRDVWVYDLDRNTRTRLTRGELMDQSPAWSPSSGEVAYSTYTDARTKNIEVRRADGSGEAHVLVSGPAVSGPGASTWSKRGDYLLYGTHGDIEGVPIDEAGETGDPRPFVATAAMEGNPSLSPDGRFLAYTSNESGRDEVYVQTFPDGGQRFTVSVEGGRHPRWNGSGDELFYVEGNTLMSVAVSSEPDFSTGAPRRLFSGDEIQAELVAYGERTYDVTADGQRFVVVRGVIEGEPRVTVIQNWPALLREREE